MKPTQEQILSALNKLVRENKTGLKSEKIQLGIVQEMDKLLAEKSKEISEIKKYKDLKKDKSIILKIDAKVGKALGVEFRVQKIDKKIKSLEKELIKVAKGLGVKPMDMPVFKSINKVANEMYKENEIFKSALSIRRMLKI